VRTIPPPDSIEQARMLAAIRENAINYTKSLPNYICGRVTRRHIDPSGTEFWREADRVYEQLTFFDQEEKLKVISVSGKLVSNVEHDQLGGARSKGEFGYLLFEIFSPETDTEFHWERWATLREKRMAVFGFRVRQSRSKYSIYHQQSRRQIVAGYSGLVYADKATNQVMRIAMHCEDMPADFPIQEVSVTLDYDPTLIGDQTFVLPLKSDLRSREGRFMVWNETEFKSYRKFSADASITFDTSDSIPEEKLKETPAKTGREAGRRQEERQAKEEERLRTVSSHSPLTCFVLSAFICVHLRLIFVGPPSDRTRWVAWNRERPVARFTPSRRYFSLALIAVGGALLSAWTGWRWQPAWIAAVLFGVSAPALLLLALRPKIEIHETHLLVGPPRHPVDRRSTPRSNRLECAASRLPHAG
jgi:hypothetical protein